MAIRSNRSFTNEFMMLIALLEMPVSGCTCGEKCLSGVCSSQAAEAFVTHLLQNFIDVHRVSLFPLGFSFRLFITGTFALLFRYVIRHFTKLANASDMAYRNSYPTFPCLCSPFIHRQSAANAPQLLRSRNPQTETPRPHTFSVKYVNVCLWWLLSFFLLTNGKSLASVLKEHDLHKAVSSTRWHTWTSL